MVIVFSTVFLASLLGSLHCVGMCGPFALIAGSKARSRAAAMAPTVAYSLGRLITYSLMGLIFGGLGLAINQGASFNQWQQLATYLAGILMVFAGSIAALRCFGFTIPLPSAAGPLQRLLQSLFQRTIGLSPLKRAVTIGMLTTLMPCGWLYVFAIAAAGTGSPLMGMLLMIAFWAGTVPIMSALMLGIHQIGHRWQQRLPLLMSSLVVFLGLFTIAYRAPIDLSPLNQQAGVQSPEALVENLRNVDHASLPCCQAD
jgi:sulfite exporter TauE/SafE